MSMCVHISLQENCCVPSLLGEQDWNKVYPSNAIGSHCHIACHDIFVLYFLSKQNLTLSLSDFSLSFSNHN